MENKRKANSSATVAADADDRAAKRRKGALVDDYDLYKGETKETTLHYGRDFLEHIRRTGDKSGRRVAGYFERLPSRDGNEDYYRRTRMPISLETTELKLNNGEFNNLSELESYIKRMVSNAKDYYHKNSQIFEDAERVRKALSNYMVRHNPAYKLVPGYTATATPLPPDSESELEQALETDMDAEGFDEEDAEGEDEDAEGESDDDADRIVIRRRGPGRPPKSVGAHTPKVVERQPPAGTKPDYEYESVPYQGLSFQYAQEKIVEELIRKPDEDDEGYAYFEPFLNLPPRSLKDYYQVIKEPISLRKFQKLVKGIHGRGERSNVTEFKSWAVFEEKASLLWQNAYFYNEDGSDIAMMAKELEQSFHEQLKQAKAVVHEPAQPKIKIKMPLGHDAIPASHKKITITVANRGSSADSPAPATGGSVSSDGAVNGIATQNPFRGQHAGPSINLSQLDKTRSMSGSVASPSPSVATKREDAARHSPAVLPRANGITSAAMHTPATLVPYGIPVYPGASLQNGHHFMPTAPRLPHEDKSRPPGRGVADALITNLSIRTHPAFASERRFRFKLAPHPKDAHQTVTISVPANHWKQQVIITLSPSIQEQQRPYKLFVATNGVNLGPAIPVPNDPIEHGAKLYEAQLHPGINTIQIHMIAALPGGQKLPNGSDVELEKITVLANLTRQ